MTDSRLAAVVLAAGQGTRMKSEEAKVLHLLAGSPLIRHVLEAVRPLGASHLVVVIGYQADAVRAACDGYQARFALQGEQRGTGHAVECALRELEGFQGDVLIVYGDVPLLGTATLLRLIATHRSQGASLSLLTTKVDDPTGYGRIIRDPGGELAGIVEHRDATSAQRAIHEINPGIYCVRSEFLVEALEQLSADNAQGELYLTDMVATAVKQNKKIASDTSDPQEVAGINSRAELAQLERTQREAIVRRHMEAGVTIVDPDTVYIEASVTIGSDTVIGPLTQLRGRTTIGRGCRIDGSAYLENVTLADKVHLRPLVVITDSEVASEAIVGPFSHLRPGTKLERGVHIGNFVEVKKSTLGEGTKANHLAYLGDATIGRETNIGAGTITCNYDGFAKHQTVIGDRVQVGSDSQLVAPIKVGDDAYIATGTTVRHEVEPGALAFNPKPDQRRSGWVEGFRKRKR